MKGVVITGMNKTGNDAILQHIAEVEGKALSFKERMMAKAMFEHKVLSRDPAVVQIIIKQVALQQLMTKDSFVGVIDDALRKNGAEKDDYRVEVLS